MPKVYVIQTFPGQRHLLAEFIRAAGVDVYESLSYRENLEETRRLMGQEKEPFAVVTSQRDPIRDDELGNKNHTAALRAKQQTCTIVYAYSVGNPAMKSIQDKMEATAAHRLHFVKKTSEEMYPNDDATIAERQEVLGHIQNFFASLRQPA